MPIPLEAWLDVMRAEYLASFIPDGGSAVRFVVADTSRIPDARDGLRRIGDAHGLIVVEIDTVTTKLHLLQNLFFAIAEAIDWEALTQRQLERMVATSGYRWPTPGRRATLATLAEANAVAPGLLRKQISQEITSVVWQDARMAQDFRSAMIALLDTRMADDREPLRDAVVDWLRGRLSRIGLVKDAQIAAKIGRHNARAMLKSLCHWLRVCGDSGVLLVIDISRLLRERRDVLEGHVYSPAAVMDCYEVLRQMIDDADEIEGFFLGVLADPSLLSEDHRRSLNQYTALKMRVWDDVRPEHGENMLAPLVQVQ